MSTTTYGPHRTEEQRKAEGRSALVLALAENGWHNVADFIRDKYSQLQLIEGRELASAGRALSEALRADGAITAEVNLTSVGWAVYYQLKELVARQNREKVSAFIGSIISLFVFFKTNKGLSERGLREAECRLKSFKPAEEWSGWALSGLEQLMLSLDDNVVTDFFRDNPREVTDDPEELIQRLQGFIRSEICKQREALAKNKAAKASDRRQRQLRRAEACRAMRGSNPSVAKPGSGKKKGKGK